MVSSEVSTWSHEGDDTPLFTLEQLVWIDQLAKACMVVALAHTPAFQSSGMEPGPSSSSSLVVSTHNQPELTSSTGERQTQGHMRSFIK